MRKGKWYQKPIYLLIALALVLSLGIVAVPMAGTVGAATGTIQVDVNHPGCVTGTPQPDPYSVVYCSIQDAIDDASPGDVINVAAGTYAENITLKDGVEVLGAGADVTTIDGGGGGSVVFGSGVGSTTKLDGFTITNGSYQYGGGIFLRSSSSPTISNCIFSGNWAFWGGGMFNHQGSSPTVTNCIFSGNSASCGGGIYNRIGCSPTVTNCIFSGNSAGSGGGMSNSHTSRPRVTNCVFSGNSATTGGGMWNSEFSSPTVTNCILWDNGQEIYNNDFLCTPVVTYCDIQGGYPGVTNIDANPMFVDPTNNDYHLQAVSPCIDAGTNDGAPTEDIERNPRPIDGNGDGIATTDMGAHEYMPPPPPVGGEAYPVNKFAVLAPWIALAVLLAGGGGWYTLRRRRARG